VEERAVCRSLIIVRLKASWEADTPAAEDRVISVKDSPDQNQHAGSFFVKPDIEVDYKAFNERI
jgi:hypothetical protein